MKHFGSVWIQNLMAQYNRWLAVEKQSNKVQQQV